MLGNCTLGKRQLSDQFAAGTRRAGHQQAHDSHADRVADALGDGRLRLLVRAEQDAFKLVHAAFFRLLRLATAGVYSTHYPRQSLGRLVAARGVTTAAGTVTTIMAFVIHNKLIIKVKYSFTLCELV